jgi:hypothetical protein
MKLYEILLEENLPNSTEMLDDMIYSGLGKRDNINLNKLLWRINFKDLSQPPEDAAQQKHAKVLKQYSTDPYYRGMRAPEGPKKIAPTVEGFDMLYHIPPILYKKFTKSMNKIYELVTVRDLDWETMQFFVSVMGWPVMDMLKDALDRDLYIYRGDYDTLSKLVDPSDPDYVDVIKRCIERSTRHINVSHDWTVAYLHQKMGILDHLTDDDVTDRVMTQRGESPADYWRERAQLPDEIRRPA